MSIIKKIINIFGLILIKMKHMNLINFKLLIFYLDVLDGNLTLEEAHILFYIFKF